MPHVDLTKVAEYTAEAAKPGGPDDASLDMVWHKLSELPVVSIAITSDAAKGRTTALFTQGLQTRGPLELDLGERVGAL